MEKYLGKEEQILSIFGKNSEIATRTFKVLGKTLSLFYIDCLIDNKLISNGIISSIIRLKNKESDYQTQDLIDILEKECISIASIKKLKEETELKEEVFNGSVVIAIMGESEFLSINTAGFVKRAVTEPPTSSVVRGPREGFIEDLEVNVSLIRRRLKTETLAIKRLKCGKRTKTNLALMFLEDVINPKILKSLEDKLNEINIDGIIDSYYVEELLEKSEEKFFKRLGNTEKPDVAVSRILEGRIAILVDGSPIVLTAPFILFEDMQSPGDYYDIPHRTSFVRFVRLVGLLLAILLPGMYVALQSYHYRVLPINFLISLLSSIEGISFPPILEILFVLFLFEILNEASVRMPKQLGMALSIIGALVLGDTAVQAGIITPPSIVVVAISGITLYIIPNQSSEASLLRTLFTIVGGIAGFYGIFLGFIMLSIYLVSIQTFDTPYMAPYAPTVATDKKDGFIKKPLTNMIYRPKSFSTLNSIRQQPFENKFYKVKNSNKKIISKRCTRNKGGVNGTN